MAAATKRVGCGPCLRSAAMLAVIAAWAVPAGAGDGDDPGRLERAAEYLDARQDAWSQFARADRGQGADRTTCVSCHTGISYVLARPALGRFVAEPAAAEKRRRAEAGLRVEHWAELDTPRFRLMYDASEQKKRESRGTEAVLNALVLARADAARGDGITRAATRQAFDHLWAAQQREGPEAGSWDWLNFGLEPWEADDSRGFGAALAAIAAGSAPGYLEGPLDDPAARGVGLLRDNLKRRFADESLHNRLWILDASTYLKDLLSTEQTREVIDQLVALQNEDGGWALAPLGDFDRVDGTPRATESDGYATGLAVHMLLRTGPRDRPEVARGLAWLRAHQQPDGSWPGRSPNKQRDPATFIGKLMTDAATAFGALALAEARSP